MRKRNKKLLQSCRNCREPATPADNPQAKQAQNQPPYRVLKCNISWPGKKQKMPPLPLRSYRMFERAYAWAFPMFGEKHQIRRFYRLFQHAYTGNNLRAAVNAFCYKCADFIPKEVKECTEQACPLWMYRPGKARKGA